MNIFTLHLTLLCMVCLIVENEASSMSEDCKCWENVIYRTPCRVDGFMSESSCLAAECCYDSKTHSVGNQLQPLCYEKKGRCPKNEQCIIPGQHRRVCGHHALNQELCEERGCCFENSTYPICFYQKQHTPYYLENAEEPFVTTFQQASSPKNTTDPPVTSTVAFAAAAKPDITKTEGPEGIYVFGDMLITFQCLKEHGIPCAKHIYSKEHCIANYCCWNETNDEKLYVQCFQPTIKITNMTQETLGLWGAWSSWSLCKGENCNSGKQTRNRACVSDQSNEKRLCVGSSNETKSCDMLCPPAWASWLPWASCPNFCGPGTTLRIRKCLFNEKEIHSNNCPGRTLSGMDAKMCNKELCHHWTAWRSTPCSATCGTGARIKFRSCSGAEKKKATAVCSKQVISCESKFCRFTPHMTWGPWSKWSACTVGCGRRTQWRARSCYVFLSKYIVISEKHAECVGGISKSHQTRDCYSDWCSQWSSWLAVKSCKTAICEKDFGLERRFCEVGTSKNYPTNCFLRNSTCLSTSC